MPSFRTVASTFRHEIDKIKGSRFIATVVPAADEAACDAAVAALREELADARHHCSAWRLGRGRDSFRYNDDGEPSGSAGRPILQAIDGRDLTDVVVIVTRYFGGTKLGVGGLVRAYGGCAAEALDRAPIATVRVVVRVQIRYAYELSSAVQAVLAAHALEPEDADYGAEVRCVLAIPEEMVKDVTSELRDRSAGRIVIGDA